MEFWEHFWRHRTAVLVNFIFYIVGARFYLLPHLSISTPYPCALPCLSFWFCIHHSQTVSSAVWPCTHPPIWYTQSLPWYEFLQKHEPNEFPFLSYFDFWLSFLKVTFRFEPSHVLFLFTRLVCSTSRMLSKLRTIYPAFHWSKTHWLTIDQTSRLCSRHTDFIVNPSAWLLLFAKQWWATDSSANSFVLCINFHMTL